MSVLADPEGVSVKVIADCVNLKNSRLLEVGCGKGRITFPLAELAGHITAIDPKADDILMAKESSPENLQERIQFIQKGIEEYQPSEGSPLFDFCIFTWSL